MAVAAVRARRTTAAATLWREVSRQRMAYLFLLPALLVLVFVDFVLIPWVVPSSLAAMMFGLLFTSTGLVNTLLHNIGLTQLGLVPQNYAWLSDARTAMPTIIFTNMWKGFPFFAVMLLAAMQ